MKTSSETPDECKYNLCENVSHSFVLVDQPCFSQSCRAISWVESGLEVIKLEFFLKTQNKTQCLQVCLRTRVHSQAQNKAK